MPKYPKGIVRIPTELKPDSKRDHAWSYARIPSCQDKARRMWGRDSITELWELYSSGYKMAGDLLIENAGSYTDCLIYPVVFLYRHCIELRLKQISVEGNKLLKPQIITEKEINDILYREHNLDKLWNYCKIIIMNLFQDESEEELSSIKEKIDKFSAIDNTSYKFRYPIDTTGKPNYPIDQDIAISFIALRDIMRDLDLYLSGTAECIYDMPGHGYFLPGQPKMSEEQIADLLTFIFKRNTPQLAAAGIKGMRIQFRLRSAWPGSNFMRQRLGCPAACGVGALPPFRMKNPKN